MTTPRPQSFVTEFGDLKRRVKSLEATRRQVTPVFNPITTYIADATGAAVVSADGVAGSGLGNPALPIVFVPAYSVVDSTGWPATLSTTFVDMLTATHYVQHHWITAAITVMCGVDASAEMQVLDNGLVIAGPEVIDVGLTVVVQVNAELLTAYTDTTTLTVQTRATAGTTSVWTQVTGAWGTQTAP